MIHRPLTEYELQGVRYDIVRGNPIDADMVDRILGDHELVAELESKIDDLSGEVRCLEDEVRDLQDSADSADRLEEENYKLEDRVDELENEVKRLQQLVGEE